MREAVGEQVAPKIVFEIPGLGYSRDKIKAQAGRKATFTIENGSQYDCAISIPVAEFVPKDDNAPNDPIAACADGRESVIVKANGGVATLEYIVKPKDHFPFDRVATCTYKYTIYSKNLATNELIVDDPDLEVTP